MHLGLLVAVLVIVALYLVGGIFRYLRQELQDPVAGSRAKNRKQRS